MSTSIITKMHFSQPLCQNSYYEDFKCNYSIQTIYFNKSSFKEYLNEAELSFYIFVTRFKILLYWNSQSDSFSLIVYHLFFHDRLSASRSFLTLLFRFGPTEDLSNHKSKLRCIEYFTNLQLEKYSWFNDLNTQI